MFTKNRRGDKVIKIEDTKNNIYWKGKKLKVFFNKVFIGNVNYLWYNLDGTYYEDGLSKEEIKEMELINE